jgi:hypothetical protein
VGADKISDEGDTVSSSASNSSDGAGNKTQNDKLNNANTVSGDQSNLRPGNRLSGDIVTKNLMYKEQLKIFWISYVTNFFSILGLSFQFVTSTFFDDNNDPDHKDPNGVTLPEI